VDRQRNHSNFYLTIGFFLLAVCIALIAIYISSGGKLLSTIDLGVLAIWAIICGAAGLGVLIYALVTDAIYAFKHRRNHREVDNLLDKETANKLITAIQELTKKIDKKAKK
jgi:hypothetical protein